jgi:single-stranded-DNA-specific exonuclease
LKLRKFYLDDDEHKLGHLYESMLFFHEDPLPEKIDAVYRLNINKYGGNDSLQLILEHWVSV